MKYILTGKRGSFAKKIANIINEKTEYDVEFLLPSEINKLKEEHKVFYIHIPLMAAWDWIVTDPYNNDLIKAFEDEIMEFRELKNCDYQIEYDGEVDINPIVDKIVALIATKKEQITDIAVELEEI